jgi:hypothetical protein
MPEQQQNMHIQKSPGSYSPTSKGAIKLSKKEP